MRCWLMLVAMEVELAAVLARQRFVEHRLSSRLGVKAHCCEAGGRMLVVAQAGVGLVSAALTSLACAEAFPNLEGIVSLGVGGGLAPGLPAGSLVAAQSVIQHDCVLSHDEGIELMAPGELHLSVAPARRVPPEFACNTALTDLFLPRGADGEAGPRAGDVLSGNEFVGSRARKDELRARHPNALVVDMESAGVAQVARRLKLPFAAIKTVADAHAPDGDATQLYRSFLDAAAAHAAAAATAFWELSRAAQ